MAFEDTPETSADYRLQFTKPVENYQRIKCPFGGDKKIPLLCYRLCRLACARECLRWPDWVCPRCPCPPK